MSNGMIWLILIICLVVLLLALIIRYHIKYAKEIRRVREEIMNVKGWDEFSRLKQELRYLHLSFLPVLTPKRLQSISQRIEKKSFQDKYKKKKSDGFFGLIAPSIIGIVVCCGCLFAVTFAWFTDSVQTRVSPTKSAEFYINVSVEACGGGLLPIENGVAQLTEGTAYEVTVKVAEGSTSTIGYCKIESEALSDIYYTKTLHTFPDVAANQSNEVTFMLYAEKSGEYTFSGSWGNSLNVNGLNDGDWIGEP